MIGKIKVVSPGLTLRQRLAKVRKAMKALRLAKVRKAMKALRVVDEADKYFLLNPPRHMTPKNDAHSIGHLMADLQRIERYLKDERD